MATSIAKQAARAGPNFKIGGKKVYLPNHVITFVRPQPRTPAKFATFIVPLQFNKLDLRDYLWHVYSVGVRSVRSFINQQPISRRGIRGTGKYYRPRAQKRMTVELEQPFSWPDVPSEQALKKDFDKGVFDTLDKAKEAQRQEQINRQRGVIPMRDEIKDPNAKKLEQQAKDLLTGREKWKGGVGES